MGLTVVSRSQWNTMVETRGHAGRIGRASCGMPRSARRILDDEARHHFDDAPDRRFRTAGLISRRTIIASNRSYLITCRQFARTSEPMVPLKADSETTPASIGNVRRNRALSYNNGMNRMSGNPKMPPPKPLQDPAAPPEHDPPTKPLRDPPGDPTYEPTWPIIEPTTNPASDPPPGMPGDPL
jgi:hypothetical protein